MKENRKVKDSVFTDLFQNHKSAQENALSLYNALHDTSYSDPGMVTSVHVDDTLYMGFKNDVSFLIEDKILILVEHQSTINENMPLRCLLYAAQLYEKIVPVEDRYRQGLVKIPTPEFFVLYNGVEDYPEEKTLKISEAYQIPSDGELPLELEVKVYNINSEKGGKLLSKCDILKQYASFIASIRRYHNQQDSFRKAILECIRMGILKDYLLEKGSEVVNFLQAEYDYAMDIKVKQQESHDKGYKEGHEDGIEEGKILVYHEDMGLSDPEIAEKLGISEEVVRKVILSNQK